MKGKGKKKKKKKLILGEEEMRKVFQNWSALLVVSLNLPLHLKKHSLQTKIPLRLNQGGEGLWMKLTIGDLKAQTSLVRTTAVSPSSDWFGN